MALTHLATQCGVSTTQLQQLLKGKVSASISTKLGVPASALQVFINGKNSTHLASKLGITSSALKELRKNLDTQGAVGFLLGLITPSNQPIQTMKVVILHETGHTTQNLNNLELDEDTQELMIKSAENTGFKLTQHYHYIQNIFINDQIVPFGYSVDSEAFFSSDEGQTAKTPPMFNTNDTLFLNISKLSRTIPANSKVYITGHQNK